MKKRIIIYSLLIIFCVSIILVMNKENPTGIHKILDELGFVSNDSNIYTIYDEDFTTEINLENNMCTSIKLAEDYNLYIYYNYYSNETNAVNVIYSYNEVERVFSLKTYEGKSDDLIINSQINEAVSKCNDYMGDYKKDIKKSSYDEIEFEDFIKRYLTKFDDYDDVIEGDLLSISFDEENISSKGDSLYLLNDENEILGIDLMDGSYKKKQIMGSKANYVNNGNLIYDDYYIPINFGYYSENEMKYGGSCLNCDKELMIYLDDKEKYSTKCINLGDISYSYINEEWFEIKDNDSSFLVDSDSGSIIQLSLSHNENIVSINNDIIKTNHAYYDITGKRLEYLTMFYDEILDVTSYKGTLFLLVSDNIIYKYNY